ncbi:DUF6086 family protein, partial [Streptomyces sp. NPDC047970]|uniref:DUF6086 family protein n=1 Tax=Streptomyces sp. NPDC047970 TaxID=3155481 RepID=UPI0034397461
HRRTGHAVVLALSEGFTATVLVLAERAGIEPELPPGARILPAGRRFLPARGPRGPAAVRGYSPAAASALASGDSFAAGSSLAAATAATASFAARTAPLAMSVTEGFFAPA